MNRKANLLRILTLACYILIFLSSASITRNVTNQESSREINILDYSSDIVEGDSKLSISDFSMVNSSLDMYSTNVGDEYKIQLGIPSNYNESLSFIYPTIYLTDANYFFDDTNQHPNAVIGPGGAIGIIEELIETGYLPPSILVGIDYEGDLNNQRSRDFRLPTSRQAFYHFLEEELIPFIDGNFRTDISSRTLMGHSLGATFVTYCLFQHNSSITGLFNQFIMLSGAYGKYLDPIEVESSVFASFANVTSPSLNLSVFSAIGEQDTSVDVPINTNMINMFKSRYYKDFRFLGKIYEEHDHPSIVRPGFIEGLKWVFSNTSVDFELNASVIKEGEVIQFTFTGVEGKKPFSYEWDFGDNTTTSSEMNPSHEFSQTGIFSTKLTITDGDGFQVSKQVVITVEKQDSVNGFTSFGIVSFFVIVILAKKKEKKVRDEEIKFLP
jgi:enterochelin esterase-like enzyme